MLLLSKQEFSKMFRKQKILLLIETLVLGVTGGMLFSLLFLPLPWMLGPLTTVFVWKLVTKRKLLWPANFRNSGQMLLGYSMGLTFTIDSAKQIINQLPLMAASTIFMVGFGITVAYSISRFTGIGIPSAVMGTTPGGLSQMVLLSEEIKGADPTIVTFMQTVRMLIVIFTVPGITIHALSTTINPVHHTANALAQQTDYGHFFHYLLILSVIYGVTLIAVRFKCPTPWIISPLATAAFLTVIGFNPPHLPPIIIVIAQIFLGVYLGMGIKLEMLGDWRKLLPFTILAGILIVGFSLILAYVLHILQQMSLTTAFLSIAPGGLPEMGVTAHIVNADVSMVAAYQLFRVFFILFIVPLLLRLIFGKSGETAKVNPNVN